MPLGCHVSISPKPVTAISQAKALGAQTIQIFTHNPRGWAFKLLNEAQMDDYRAAAADYGVSPIIAHSNYLINIASCDEQAEKSQACLKKELEYADAFGCAYLVLHMGSHVKRGRDVGMKRMVANLTALEAEIVAANTMICLENLSCSGSHLGRLEDIKELLDSLPETIRHKMGVCIDTCHLHSSGHDLSSEKACVKAFAAIEDTIGFESVKCMHVNDSKGECGSLVDRHDHLGSGTIGKPGFKAFLNHPKLRDLPMILETPTDDRGGYEMDLKSLRAIVG